MTTAESVRAAVGAVHDPELRRSLGDLDMIGSISVGTEQISVEVRLTIVGCPAADRIAREVRDAALTVSDGIDVAVELTVMSPAERAALVARVRGERAERAIPFGPDSLTRVIAVTSGKGGVGKSTITANLAAALATMGFRVGLIDADIHGFSIPGMFGLDAARPTRVNELMIPPEAHGVRVLSIGMFLEHPGSAVAWRGPMLHRALAQFLTDSYFGDLDFLLIDTPPGTGDVAISLGQLLPRAEVVIVTTPQPAAAEVAERSGQLAAQTGQIVRGVIENMAGWQQSDGTRVDLFGSGGGALAAARLTTELLGSIPLSVPARSATDSGVPVVLDMPDDPAARELTRIAKALVQRPAALGNPALNVGPKELP